MIIRDHLADRQGIVSAPPAATVSAGYAAGVLTRWWTKGDPLETGTVELELLRGAASAHDSRRASVVGLVLLAGVVLGLVLALAGAGDVLLTVG